MKRRSFAALAGCSALALKAGHAFAQAAPVSALGAGLTPIGSEQAGNADGSIPPWTGGMTTLPAGLKPGDYVPELFPDEQPVVVVDSSNMADHDALLSEGVKAMMTKYGFKIKVYPTHRTAAMPQYVYDNIAKNKANARFVAQDTVGGRFGFENAFGGAPFPIPDTSNPYTAGGQIIWNHNTAWFGYCRELVNESWTVANGQASEVSIITEKHTWPYYDPNGSAETFGGHLSTFVLNYNGPQNLVGQELLFWEYTDPSQHPTQAWELLPGQGRVRRAPELTFDTPVSTFDGFANYDEIYGFNGSTERYDWKYLGKQEMYIPYNNNKLYGADPAAAHLAHFLDPDLVRWEKHRCWVVEATLHPGERNTLAKRRFYVDEDTWLIGVSDEYDSNDTLVRVNLLYNNCRPELPGLIPGNNCVHNLQKDDYCSNSGGVA